MTLQPPLDVSIYALCTYILYLSQVMLAASYWSLLAPAIELATESRMYGSLTFVPIAVGFAGGAVFVYLADLLLPILVS